MVDVQVRGPSGVSGNYGIGILGFSYSISGGEKGIQLQGQSSALGLAARVSYSTGYQEDAGDLSVQGGFGGTAGFGNGIMGGRLPIDDQFDPL
jgi:hypothetical protein